MCMCVCIYITFCNHDNFYNQFIYSRFIYEFSQELVGTTFWATGIS